MTKNKVLILKDYDNLHKYTYLDDVIISQNDKYFYKGMAIDRDVLQYLKNDVFIYDIKNELILMEESLSYYISRHCEIVRVPNLPYVKLNSFYDGLMRFSSYDPLVIALTNYEYSLEAGLSRSLKAWGLVDKGYVKRDIANNSFHITELGIKEFIKVYRNLPFEYDKEDRVNRYWFAYYLNQYILKEMESEGVEKSKTKFDYLDKIKGNKKQDVDKREYLMNVLAQEQVREQNYLRNQEISK